MGNKNNGHWHTRNEIQKCQWEEKTIEARDFLRGKILEKIIIIDCLEFDKYGRLLGNVFLENDNNDEKTIEISLSQLMIDNGFAKVYDGGHKEGWNELDG